MKCSFNRYLGVVLLHQFSVRYDENFIQKGIFLVDVDVEILIVIIFQLTQKSQIWAKVNPENGFQ